MWELLNTLLKDLGPVLAFLIITVVSLMAFIGWLVKSAVNRGSEYSDLQHKVANLYHESLDDLSELRVRVEHCQEQVTQLNRELAKTRIILMDIRNSLLKLKRRNPTLNGDLDQAIDSITALLYSVVNNSSSQDSN